MLNWHFEASNDKNNWVTLDRRIYKSGDHEQDMQYEKEQNELC